MTEPQSGASKRCTTCKQVKPLEAFWAHREGATGRVSRCADCSNEWARTHRPSRRGKGATINRAITQIDNRIFNRRRPAFFARGACRGADPNVFHPTLTRRRVRRSGPAKWTSPYGQSTRALDAARTICKRCPVRLQCLTYAMENKEDRGIWAGVPTDAREMAITAGISPEEVLKAWA